MKSRNFLDKVNSLAFSTNIFIWGIPLYDPGKDNLIREIDFKIFNTSIIGHAKYGFPYGSYAKNILLWIESQIVFSKNGLGNIERIGDTYRLYFGESLSEFARKIGFSCDGRTLNNMKEQILRITGLQFCIGSGNRFKTEFIEFPLSDFRYFYWDIREDGLGKKSFINISKSYFEMVCKRGFPLKIEVIKNLRSSAIGIDFYKFIKYRSNQNRRIQIPMKDLRESFGCRSSVTDLKKMLTDYYDNRIKPYEPSLDIKFSKGKNNYANSYLIINSKKSRQLK